MLSKAQKIAYTQKAIKVLEENGWCRGNNAKDEDDNSIYPKSKHAVKFCAYGALVRVTPDGSRIYQDLTDEIKQFAPDKNLVHFNDKIAKRKRDVISVFKKYLKSLEN